MNEEPAPDPSTPTADDHQRMIDHLKTHVAEMAVLATGMVADGVRVLLTADKELSKSVVSRAAPLDRFDLDIETETVRAVAILQPEGTDLRTVEAVLKIGSCVDRIGRLGYDLGRYVVPAPPGADDEVRPLLQQMDTKARLMVVEAMEAFLSNDAPRAKKVFVADDEVDALHRQVQMKIISLLRKGGPATDRLAYELIAARHLERVADNACKIAEKAVYAITGERRSEYLPAVGHKLPIPDRAGPPALPP